MNIINNVDYINIIVLHTTKIMMLWSYTRLLGDLRPVNSTWNLKAGPEDGFLIGYGHFGGPCYIYNVRPPSDVCWFRFAPVTSSL